MNSNHVAGDVRLGTAAAAAVLVFLTLPPAHGQSGPLIEAVTDAELAATPDGDWLSFRGNLSAWAYSALDAVNTETVGQLDFAWAAPMEDGPNEATPLVRGGIVYLPQTGDVIHALDARTGDLIWEYRREHDYLDPEGADPARRFGQGLGRITRNIAIWQDGLFVATMDAFIIRLDANTGELVWETRVGDSRIAHSSGPIIADGKVISGRSCNMSVAGGCYLTAHDAVDGRELWRFHTIPRPGEPGDETWGGLPLERRFHVGAWHVGSYDPDLGLVYWGTSVPAPSPEVLRGSGAGSLLYSNSTLALRADTGELAWYFQHLPRDNWDLDHPFERILVDLEMEPDDEAAWSINPTLERGDRRRVMTGFPGKTAIFWTLDRETGEFLWARETVFQNVITHIDPHTGTVTVNEEVIPKARDEEYGVVCPAASGGKDWPTAAYSPLTEAVYAPLQDVCMSPTITGTGEGPPQGYGIAFNMRLAPNKTTVGRLDAVSARTGESLWRFEEPAGMMSAMTTGGGDLLSGLFNRLGNLRARSGANMLYAFKLSDSAGRGPIEQPAVAAAAGEPPPMVMIDAPLLEASAPCATFSAEQAERGAALYQEECAECHGPTLRGGTQGAALAGRSFTSYWQNRAASGLYRSIRETMPQGREGTIGPAASADLVAFLLRENGAEATSELDSDTGVLDGQRTCFRQ
ncbi:MAG: PQQ-binding-like beta-propeller repeat protein [Acidobacteriota bacterium]|nr:PQQ-binding-like beta-propeller repeat protein [Acidobacteriota bacterium]